MLHACMVILALTASSISLAKDLGYSGTDELVVGIFPRRSPSSTVRMYRPLVDYLQASLGIEVKLEPAKNYAKFIQHLSEGRYDLVHLNQTQYIQAHSQSGYQVVAQNEEFGQPYIKSAIFSKADSPIHKLTDLKGKRIIFWGDQSAMVSYIVPTVMLREAGLKKGDYEEKFAINPPNAVVAVHKGLSDAAGAGEVAIMLPMVKNIIDVSSLRKLAVGDALPHLPWAMKGELPAELIQKTTQLLLSLDQTERGKRALLSAKLSRLNAAQDSDYDPARALLATYNRIVSLED